MIPAEHREYPISVGGRTVHLLGPADPDALCDDPDVERRFQQDKYLPYWATPWPAAVMLANHLRQRLAPGPGPILELGAGLGLVGISLALAGHRVVVTDYDQDALRFVRLNAARAGVTLGGVHRLDWRDPPPERYATIVAADVLYERRNHQPLARFLAAGLAERGTAWICDPDRGAAVGFDDALRAEGLVSHTSPARAPALSPLDTVDRREVTGTIHHILRRPP